MTAAAQWLRIWVFSMEVPGSNNGKLFRHFSCIIFTPVTVVLEQFDPTIYNCLV